MQRFFLWLNVFEMQEKIRTTFDIDFACQIAAWNDFDKLFRCLLEHCGLYEDPRKDHSLR